MECKQKLLEFITYPLMVMQSRHQGYLQSIKVWTWSSELVILVLSEIAALIRTYTQIVYPEMGPYVNLQSSFLLKYNVSHK